jgi:hypothetical protein
MAAIARSDGEDVLRPKMMTYTPTIIELMDGGKNWLIPPRIIITPTAKLTRRLEGRNI